MKYEHEDLGEFLFDIKDEGVKKIGLRIMHDSREAGNVLVDGKQVKANTITALIMLSAASDKDLYSFTELISSETVFSEEQLEKLNETIEKRSKQISTEIMEQLPKCRIFRGAVQEWAGKQ